MRKTFLSIVALLLALLAIYFIVLISQDKVAIPAENAELENGARLVWQDCWFNAPNHVACARLHTAPEQGTDASSFSLPVVIIRYQGFKRKNDPVIYMAGGPGSGAGLGEEQIGYWLNWFKKADLQRDFVLFDQRGTGLSEPKLSCPAYRQAIRDSFARQITSREKTEKTHSALKACYQKMKQEGVPVDELSTLHSAADVRDLMDALDYPTWNLQGVSYSTRLATVIEQKNPGRVRSMVLDSVYPVQKHFFKEWPSLLDASLKKIFTFCDNQAACKREYGNIQTKFWETMDDLKKNPLRVEVTDSSLIFPEVIFSDDTFIDFLFDNQYDSGSLYDLPAVIDAFNRRDSDLLKDYIHDFLQSRLQDSISEVVFRAVECKDNPSVDIEEMTKVYNQYPKLKPYLATEYDACDIWNNKKDSMGINELTKESEVPVLILSGEDDPVTPIHWVDDVLIQYQNSQFFKFPNISHSVMDRMGCGIDLYRQFVNDPYTRPTADCRHTNTTLREN